MTKHEETGSLEACLTAGSGSPHANALQAGSGASAEEQEWVTRARHSDTRAFEALYRTHASRVYALCLRMTGVPAEAEDCTQETFIQAWRHIDRFRGDSAFGTWLHRVAVNAVLGRMRKSKREQERLRVVADSVEGTGSIGDSGGIADLEQAMQELPSGARHVFVLNAVYGYSHEETGEMLGIAAGTSKAQLHRARRLLARQLDLTVDES